MLHFVRGSRAKIDYRSAIYAVFYTPFQVHGEVAPIPGTLTYYHCSILSRNGASDKPGAIHSDIRTGIAMQFQSDGIRAHSFGVDISPHPQSATLFEPEQPFNRE